MRRNLDPKTRRFIALGSASLALGLLLRTSVHPAGPMAHNALDAAAGLLIGISIGVNLSALVIFRRCRKAPE